MARTFPSDRPRALIDAGTAIFVAEGYRRAEMAKVAAALGMAKGSLYGCVESKEALFEACVRWADEEGAPLVEALPLKATGLPKLVDELSALLAEETSTMRLFGALDRGRRPRDVALELGQILADIFDRLARHRRKVKLVDRSAKEFPKLAELWFGAARWAQVDLLATYLERRRLASPEHSKLTARLAIETLAFWAVHRHWDPSPGTYAEEAVRRQALGLVLRAILSEPHSAEEAL